MGIKKIFHRRRIIRYQKKFIENQRNLVTAKQRLAPALSANKFNEPGSLYFPYNTGIEPVPEKYEPLLFEVVPQMEKPSEQVISREQLLYNKIFDNNIIYPKSG